MPNSFDPTIAQRGRAYHAEKRVQNIRQISKQHFSATVKGSYPYRCEIWLDKQGQYSGGKCSCPYDWGGACKHQVALWYAIQDWQETENASVSPDELANKLAKCNEAQLRQLLLTLAEDSDNYQRLLLLLSNQQTTKNWQPMFQQQIAGLFYETYDEYIDEELEWVNADKALQWLNDVAQLGQDALVEAIPMLANRLATCWQQAAELGMQDEDDTPAMCLEECFQAVEKLLSSRELSEQSRHKLCEFLESALDNSDFEDFERELYRLRSAEWSAQEQYDDWLAWLDTQHTDFYRQEKLKVLQEAGRTKQAEQFFQQNLAIPEFREQAIEQARKVQNWAQAEMLLQQGIESRDDLWKLNWQKQLAEVYQAQGKLNQLRELYFGMMLENHQHHDFLANYQLWKQTIVLEQWEKELNALLAILRKAMHENPYWYERERLFKVLGVEGLGDELLAYLLQEKDLALLAQYDKYLNKNQLLGLYPRYRKSLIIELNQAGNRQGYQKLQAKMQAIGKRCPVLQEKLLALRDEWLAQYPKRPALLEELRKLRF